MDHRFPTIHCIDDILPCVEGREDIIVGEREGFTFVDYVVTLPDTFQDPSEPGISPEEQHHRLLRMECRGIKFHASGAIAARPYHKFFNVGERAWTQCDVLPWSQQFDIFNKLDGSMIHPLWLNGVVHFCTRMGITDVAVPALDHAWEMDCVGDTNYHDFLEFCENEGWTPIFEWCSRKQRIVIDHPVDRLVLTGIRWKVSGEYLESFQAVAQTFGIPTVNEWAGSWKGVGRFLDDTKQLLDAEGYVIRWRDGYMAKTKGEWYCSIHRAMDAVHWEKDVVELILDKGVDDVLPNLLPADSERLESFQAAFWEGCLWTIGKIKNKVEAIQLACPHKENGKERERWMATEIKKEFKNPLESLAFKVYRGHDPLQHIVHVLRLQIGSGPRLDRNRALFGGIRWEDF